MILLINAELLNDLITIINAANNSTTLSTPDQIPFDSKYNYMTTLDLANSGIEIDSHDKGIALATELSKMKNLRHLILSNCKIGDDGAEALALALPKMKNLRHLILSNCNISDDGVKALALALPKMKNLKELNLDFNKIGDDGAEALALALPNMTGLKFLYIADTRIGDDGAVSFNSIKQNRPNLIIIGLPIPVENGNTKDDSTDYKSSESSASSKVLPLENAFSIAAKPITLDQMDKSDEFHRVRATTRPPLTPPNPPQSPIPSNSNTYPELPPVRDQENKVATSIKPSSMLSYLKNRSPFKKRQDQPIVPLTPYDPKVRFNLIKSEVDGADECKNSNENDCLEQMSDNQLKYLLSMVDPSETIPGSDYAKYVKKLGDLVKKKNLKLYP